MKRKLRLLVLVGAMLFGAVGLGSADRSWADDVFYVIAVSPGTFKGAWSSTTVYHAKDIVFYNGSSWFSLLGQNQNKAPNANSIYWTMLAQKGDTGPPGPSQYKGELTWSYHRTESASGSVNVYYTIKVGISYVGGSYYIVQGKVDMPAEPGEKPLIISGSAILEGSNLMITMHGSQPWTDGMKSTSIFYANVDKTTFNGTAWGNTNAFDTINREMYYDYSAGTLNLTSAPIPLP